jgi:hypothetical protein
MTAQIIQFRPRANPNRERIESLQLACAELYKQLTSMSDTLPPFCDTQPCEMNPDDCA